MKRLVSILRDRRTQYCVIVWILLLKVMDIVACLLSEMSTLQFFAMLGFESLSTGSRLAWDGLVVSAVLLLCYRLLKDIFGFSVSMRPFSKLKLSSLLLFVIWIFLVSLTALQFAALATAPLADPKLEGSTYYAPVYCRNFNEKIEILTGDMKLGDWERTNATLDLSRSVFMDPFSVYKMGETAQYGTSYVGASYFSVKESPIGQKMVEMKFHGNGTEGVGGWFSYRVKADQRLPVGENSTLLLLVRLRSLSNSAGWTWYRIDFSTEENDIYSLVWSFHNVPTNRVYKKENGTVCHYNIGSVVNWRFYQFSLYDIFYTSFSKKPSYVTGVRYAIGADCSNDVDADFLVAKISPQPFEINGLRVEDVNTIVDLENGGEIIVEGLHFRKVSVASDIPLERKDVNYQLEFLGISRIESYGWSLGGVSNATRFKAEFTFDVSSQASKFFLMDEEITSRVPQQGTHSVELHSASDEMTLVVVSSSNNHSIPFVLLMPIVIVLINALSKWMKNP